MKLILLLGIFVFVEIVVGHNEHIKSRQKRGHKSHKKELHFTKEDHKESHVRSPNTAPSAPGQQERFHKFLDKWEKFSEPNKKWHKAPLHKKNHDENEKHMKNNKETLVKNNEHKMAFGKRKHHEIEAHHKLNKKTNDEPKHISENKVGKLDDLKANIKGKWKKSHLASKDRIHMRKNMWNKRRFRDFSKHMSKYGRNEQIRKNLDKHRNHKRERKDNDMEKENHSKFERRHNYLERKSHFGRRAEGHKPFGRQNKMHFGPDSKFCSRSQTVKCPDYKREVCGSDGKTYQNRCLLMSELCKKDSKIDLNLTKRGACDDRNIVH